MKIAFFDTKPYDKPSFDKFGEKHGVKFKYFETKLTEDTVNLARGYDGVCVFVNDVINASVIDSLVGLGVKTIALRCAGYNNVDVKHAKGKIRVVRVPAYSPYAVAEHAIAMLLTSIRRIHKSYLRTRDFNFSLSGLTGFDLHGKTVGVIGTGKIGQVFIDICKGFGMHVLAYDKFPSDKVKEKGVEYVELDKIFELCDVISLHCPLTDETYHLIDDKAIEKCKKGVAIINTSRGALVDAEALLHGIKTRKIGTACLDVYEEEGDHFFEDKSGHIMDDDVLARLISMPNVIVTSHQAFLTEEALSAIAEVTVDNLLSLKATGECVNEVCYHAGEIGDCKK
ncbi:MAG: 2-hydroxyacid dehydrogenase [Clostridia bacterium]|nr:2-hydroxyacid dehydrogenase [Clostridia bacterium]